MPLQSTSGAASYDAFGGGVAAVPKYIEEYFSTFLYSGTGAAQTITNGIDLSTKGGLVWIKGRSQAWDHGLFDTARGAGYRIISNSTAAENFSLNYVSSFNNNGFSLGSPSSSTNTSGDNYVSWSIAKAPKFFDVVTYSGSNSTQTISHNLGSTPGCIIIKKLDSNLFNAGWAVYHRSLTNPNNYYLTLNSTDAETNYGGAFISSVNSTTFTVAGGAGQISIAGSTYVAYLFAHDAGGFGLTGTDNVISCGSYGSNTTDVNLGYEPQWIMIKNTTSGIAYAGWAVFDNMRGLSMVSTSNPALLANSSTAEYGTYNGAEDYLTPTATGFKLGAGTTLVGGAGSSGTWIYIAIRRGPMKVPTSGTSVYNNLANRVGTSATATISGVGFPVDLMIPFNETSGSSKPFVDRLRGATKYLLPPYSNAEQTNTDVVTSFASNDGVIVGADATLEVINKYYNASRRYAASFFRRAPSVFDIVCYTGNGAGNNAITHNLNVAPELLIIKNRSSEASGDWFTFHNFTSSNFKKQLLDTTDAQTNYTYGSFLDAQPTNTTFTVNSGAGCNASGTTYVAYLFSTAGGVSKVGTYTGTGALQTVNCGFTSGARFILIKRTDSTGDWWLYDSARGISASNDPYLLLNTTGTSELGTNYVDTDSTGFKVTAAAPAGLNASGGTYIFLAIA